MFLALTALIISAGILFVSALAWIADKFNWFE